jgi:hypothetical protein
MNGSLENFIPFVFKDETVRGTLALRSNTIDLNEFMGGEPAEKETATVQEDSEPMNVIEVPKNIDFAMTVNIGTILFDKLVIINTAGVLSVKDGRVVMKDLGMNLLEGSMTLNGEYNTQNIAVPFVDFGVNIRQFDITSTIASFSMIEKILPEPQNYAGKVSAALTLYSVLDEHLSPVLDKVLSKGRLQTQNLEIRNSKLFGTTADLLKNEKWRTPAFNNLNIGYEIKDGRLWIEDPIVMNMPPARMELKGDQGLDTTLNYQIEAAVPVSAIGSGAANLLGNLPGGIKVNEIKLTGLIKGTAKNPEVSLGMADMAGAVKSQQIDQIMADARKQADNVRSVAKQTADRTRREANAAADRLISNAAKKSPLEKQVAKTAADKVRSEGETSARKIEQEADRQAQAALAAAQKRADELKK